MWLFRERLSDFTKNNLQTAQEWTKSYIELIASYVHPKTGNHLRSHLKAIMALDHRRLIRPGKQIRAGFLRLTSLLFKILPPVHLYITSEVKQYYEALFLSYRLRTDCMMWCDDRSMSWLLAKSIKKLPVTYTASRFSLLHCEMWSSQFEWTLIELRSNIIKKLLYLFFI